MPVNIAALAYAWLGIITGLAVCYLCFPSSRPMIRRVALSWGLLTAILMMSPPAAVFMLAAGTSLYFLSPKDPQDRLFFYCAMLLAIPFQFQWQIPFPGINFLYELRYSVLLNLVVLLPALLNSGNSPAAVPRLTGTHRAVVVFAVIYLVFTSLLDFRLTTPTHGMRLTMHYALMFGIPVLAFARFGIANDGVRKAAFGMLIGGVFVLCVGLSQWVTNWYFYNVVRSDLLLSDLPYTELYTQRGDQFRVPSTMRPIPFGIYMGLCAILAIVFSRSLKESKLAYLLIPLFIVGALLSDSRASILVVPIGLFLMMLFSPKVRAVRPLLAISGLLAMGLVFVAADVWETLDSADPYGTFRYRVDLLKNSVDSFLLHPFLGTPDFLVNPTPALEQSRQGQGIIDIVNAYLQVVLQYGSIGLIGFLIPLWLGFRSILRYRRACELKNDLESEFFARGMLSILVSYALVIFTVSLIDRLEIYYWVIIAMSSACCFRLSAAPETQPSEKPKPARVMLSEGY